MRSIFALPVCNMESRTFGHLLYRRDGFYIPVSDCAKRESFQNSSIKQYHLYICGGDTVRVGDDVILYLGDGVKLYEPTKLYKIGVGGVCYFTNGMTCMQNELSVVASRILETTEKNLVSDDLSQMCVEVVKAFIRGYGDREVNVEIFISDVKHRVVVN